MHANQLYCVVDGLRRARLATYKRLAERSADTRSRSVSPRAGGQWGRAAALAASSKIRKISKK